MHPILFVFGGHVGDDDCLSKYPVKPSTVVVVDAGQFAGAIVVPPVSDSPARMTVKRESPGVKL
jgi:hypothetical protein